MADGSITAPGPRFERTVAWATSIARDGRERDHEPALAHRLAVTAVLLSTGATTTEAAAALLLDVRAAGRRQQTARQRARRNVGRKVARLARAVYVGRRSWRTHGRGVLAQLRDPATAESVLRVRGADLQVGARAIVTELRRNGPEAWHRHGASAVDQLWYHRSASLALGQRLPGILADELQVAVREMEQLAAWWFDVGDPQLVTRPRRSR